MAQSRSSPWVSFTGRVAPRFSRRLMKLHHHRYASPTITPPENLLRRSYLSFSTGGSGGIWMLPTPATARLTFFSVLFRCRPLVSGKAKRSIREWSVDFGIPAASASHLVGVDFSIQANLGSSKVNAHETKPSAPHCCTRSRTSPRRVRTLQWQTLNPAMIEARAHGGTSSGDVVTCGSDFDTAPANRPMGKDRAVILCVICMGALQ